MPAETDADRIQRERDRRRAEERLRIEREHHRRLHNVETLRRGGAHPSGSADESPITPGEGAAGASRASEGSPDTPSSHPAGGAAHPPGPADRVREVGRPLIPDPLRAFLALDPAERFDILELNTVPISGLLHLDLGDADQVTLVADRAEALMDRVKREVDDPLNAGALLREFALRWYRESPGRSTWDTETPDRWGGIFAESKVSGGRLHPWINVRLRSLHQHARRHGGLSHRVRQGLTRARPADQAVTRTATQQIQAEVAQALLDDLAAHARKAEAPLPLVKLSELAVRRQVPTVNDALAALFSSAETGPFVVLHPNRYPDCEELQIRPPSGAATGAALAYTLQGPRSLRRPGVKGVSALPGEAGGGPAGTDDSGSEEPLDPSAIWEARSVRPSTWRGVLEEARRERHRLDGPPRDYRSRPPYASLRQLLLEDVEARKAFLAVRWRGRPAGLPLLASLLQKGQIAPDVATDHEYLEAELGELAQGDPQAVPPDGVWRIPGWEVVREGSHRDGFKYRASPAEAAKVPSG